MSEEIRGCGDNGCVIQKPMGMATNSGCRCSPMKVARFHYLRDGGPAFPCLEQSHSLQNMPSTGISIRDYFAAAALQGLLATNCVQTAKHAAEEAYMYADKMLAARAKKG